MAQTNLHLLIKKVYIIHTTKQHPDLANVMTGKEETIATKISNHVYQTIEGLSVSQWSTGSISFFDN
jgi:hypothetical protein